MMYNCKICNKFLFKGFRSMCAHLAKKHKMHWFQYFRDYENIEEFKSYNISKMYEGKLLKQLCSELSKIITKYDICKHFDISNRIGEKDSYILELNDIKKKSLSEYTKIAHSLHGVWNKGLTKNDHISLKKISEDRMGLKNPIHKLSKSERSKCGWGKGRNKYNDIRLKKIGEILKRKYKNGEIKSWNKGLTKETNASLKSASDKMKNKPRVNTKGFSCLERRLYSLLDENEIFYFKQYCLKRKKGSYYRYDAFIIFNNRKILVELNGDYWHANPSKYLPESFIKVKKCFAKDIWENDKEKCDLAIENGFEYVCVYESEMKKITDKELLNVIIFKNKANKED